VVSIVFDMAFTTVGYMSSSVLSLGIVLLHKFTIIPSQRRWETWLFLWPFQSQQNTTGVSVWFIFVLLSVKFSLLKRLEGTRERTDTALLCTNLGAR